MTKFPRKPGVYAIVHSASGRVYIGSSVDMYTRYVHHVSDLRHNRHSNERLQRAWNKYGKQAFDFRVLVVAEKDQLREYEDQMISAHPDRYNFLDQSYTTYGYRHTDETKQKISQASRDRPRRRWTEEEKQVQSLRFAGRVLAPNPLEWIAKIVKKTKGRKRSPESVERIRKAKLGNAHNAKMYRLRDLNGNVIEVTNLKLFCNQNGLSYHIRNRGYSKGWTLI